MVEKRALAVYGRELRELRMTAHYTQDALAHRVRVSRGLLSDIERGKATPSAQLREDLDRTVGGGRLSHLWRELTESGWQAWRYEVAELTRGCSALYEYQSLVLPSYVQVEEYARSVIMYGAPWLTASEVADQARDRTEWGMALTGADTPRVWLILDEGVLWRPYGGTAVQRAQLEHLAALVERQRVALQIIPLRCPHHPGNSGPRRIIASPQGETDVVFVESAQAGKIVTARADVEHSRMLFADMQRASCSPEESLTLVHAEIERLQ